MELQDPDKRGPEVTKPEGPKMALTKATELVVEGSEPVPNQ